jgi:hypothetical protein
MLNDADLLLQVLKEKDPELFEQFQKEEKGRVWRSILGICNDGLSALFIVAGGGVSGFIWGRLLGIW